LFPRPSNDNVSALGHTEEPAYCLEDDVEDLRHGADAGGADAGGPGGAGAADDGGGVTTAQKLTALTKLPSFSRAVGIGSDGGRIGSDADAAADDESSSDEEEAAAAAEGAREEPDEEARQGIVQRRSAGEARDGVGGGRRPRGRPETPAAETARRRCGCSWSGQTRGWRSPPPRDG
ncbi:MAG: hypothetical protein VXW43_19855, partial [Pseudomonadota bacterium]|nr:hypothetical protein [Pseudomonadota bacterium]